MAETVSVNLIIRHLALPGRAETVKKTIQLDRQIGYNELKKELHKICELNSETSVIKLRNKEEALVPLMCLVQEPEDFHYIDINNIYAGQNNMNLLQDAYVDAVRNKVKSIENRIAEAELLLPQLEWRRQSYMEETVNGLLFKVGFLNRRFDELLPQFRSKLPETLS